LPLNIAYAPQPQEAVPGVERLLKSAIYRLNISRDIFAVQKSASELTKPCFETNLSVDKIDWLILHQANQRILDAVAEIPQYKVISNLAASTSPPLSLLLSMKPMQQAKIKPGEYCHLWLPV